RLRRGQGRDGWRRPRLVPDHKAAPARLRHSPSGWIFSEGDCASRFLLIPLNAFPCGSATIARQGVPMRLPPFPPLVWIVILGTFMVRTSFFMVWPFLSILLYREYGLSAS